MHLRRLLLALALLLGAAACGDDDDASSVDADAEEQVDGGGDEVVADDSGDDDAAAESGSVQMSILDAFPLFASEDSDIDDGVILTGTIASGTVAVGDALCITTEAGATVEVTVLGIDRIREQVESASAGDDVGIIVDLEDEDGLAGGELGAC